MTLEQIDQLGPREFLDYVLQTPYSGEDQIEEIAERIGAIMGAILAGVIAPFRKPFSVVHDIYQGLAFGWRESQQEFILTKDRTEKLANDPETAIYKQKLFHIIKTTELLATKMGLGKVAIFWTQTRSHGAQAEFSLFHHVIKLDFYVLALSDEEIEYLIAHELAHLQHHDGTKRWILKVLSLGVQLLAFRYWMPRRALGLGMVFYGIWEELELRIYVEQERAADEKAMQILNSNRGMIAYIHRELKNGYKIKHLLKDNALKGLSQEDLRKTKKVQDQMTLQGNSRGDLIHPPLTARLAHALSFLKNTHEIISVPRTYP